MSRIHEALQRADRERKTVVVADRQEKAEPLRAVTTDFEEPPVAKAEVSFEEVREYLEPVTESLPTLEDRSTGVEQFRSLRSHVYQARFEAPLKTILIASGIPSEGKSFVAANLAICGRQQHSQHFAHRRRSAPSDARQAAGCSMFSRIVGLS